MTYSRIGSGAKRRRVDKFISLFVWLQAPHLEIVYL